MLWKDRSYPFSGILHNLHPFTKLFAGMTLAGLSLFLKNAYALGLLVASILPFLIGFLVRLKAGRAILVLLLLAIFTGINFFVSGSLSHAVVYSLRLVTFIGAPLIFSLTTSPQDLSRALSSASIPSGLTVTFLLIWRFLPCMAEEIRRVRCLADVWQLSWSAPVKLYRSTLVPMVFFLFEYTDRITLALELRGFSAEKPRSCARTLRFGHLDTLAFIASLSIMSMAIIVEHNFR